MSGRRAHAPDPPSGTPLGFPFFPPRERAPGRVTQRVTLVPIGPPGIEPGLHEPESCVLPVYYGPLYVRNREAIPCAPLCLGNTTRVLHFSMTEYRQEKLVALGFPIPSFTGKQMFSRPLSSTRANGIATQFRVHLVGFEPTTFRM